MLRRETLEKLIDLLQIWVWAGETKDIINFWSEFVGKDLNIVQAWNCPFQPIGN